MVASRLLSGDFVVSEMTVNHPGNTKVFYHHGVTWDVGIVTGTGPSSSKIS